MRFLGNRNIAFGLIWGLSLCAEGVLGQNVKSPVYNPVPPIDSLLPDPWDLPLQNDPPGIWIITFDPNDFPAPLEIYLSAEDPVDDPLIDLSMPSSVPNVQDPFPSLAAFLPGEAFEFGGLPLSAMSGRAVVAGPASNVLTKLMPFPMRIPFRPSYSGVNPGQSERVCDPTTASKLIIAESASNTVAFMNTCPFQVTNRIITGTTPAAVAITPDGATAIVSNAGSGTLSFIDIASQTLTTTLTLSATNLTPQPTSIAILPDGSYAYVIDYESQPGSIVWVVDLSSRTVVGQVNVGAFPSSIAVSPDGSEVWVPCHGDSTVYVIDTLTNSVIQFMRNISLPTGIAFAPNGTTVYLAEGNLTAGQIDVIDPTTFTIQTTIPVGNLPHVVAVTPSGHHVFVTNALSNSISQISTINNTVIRTVNLPMGLQHPLGITFLR